MEALGKVNKKDPLKPLVDNIKNGNILGIVGIAGCRNAKLRGEKFIEKLAEILLANNILVVSTGCAAHSLAQQNLMVPEAASKAGPPLRKVLEAIGKANGLESLPPVLHMGSCVDNSRIAKFLGLLAERMHTSIDKLPVAASSPELMTEKAFAIGTYFLTLGLGTHINPVPQIGGSRLVTQRLTKDLPALTGGKLILGSTPEAAANAILAHINQKRKALFC